MCFALKHMLHVYQLIAEGVLCSELYGMPIANNTITEMKPLSLRLSYLLTSCPEFLKLPSWIGNVNNQWYIYIISPL